MFEVFVSPYADGKRIPQSVTNNSDLEVGITSHSAIKKRKVSGVEGAAEDSVDAEVEIMETPPLSASSPSSGSPEDVQILKCNTVNALTDYTHPRFLCTRYPYTANQAVHSNETHCPKCFCYICQIEASKCKKWSKHCHAHNGTARKPDSESEATVEVIDIDDDEEQGKDEEQQELLVYDSDFDLHRNAENNSIMGYQLDDGNTKKRHYYNRNHERNKAREVKITEVLAKNLQLLALDSSNETPTKISSLKMEGDIPQLILYNHILIENIRVGWPYPQIMQPQRQMALYLIKALKGRRHVILESPTGTGKSAAILCTVLAWQRWYKLFGNTLDINYVNDGTEMVYDDNQEEKTPRIYYCSRTHSQVAQMVASLRKTPYRPKMAILGSRDRMCIHKKLRPRDDDSQPPANNINLSTECRMRVRNVEIFRKKAKSYHGGTYYSDDVPPISLASDTMLAPEKHSSAPKLTGANDIAHDESIVEDDMETAQLEDYDENQTQHIRPPASSCPTCPHYRSLTSKSIAKLVFRKFIPNMKVVHCCSNGGEQSKMGVHDIEDLISFGMMPQVSRNVAIYRSQAGANQNGNAPFGIMWKNGFREGKKVVVVKALVSEGEAEKEGSLSVGDVILKVNEKSVIGLSLNVVMDLIRTSKHILLLDVVPPSGEIPQDDKVTYSEHSPCPYYLSQALAAKADLVFAPYNYILDPAIRSAMGINLANSVVILDEAHNIEDILRESGSGKFTEIEMCEMVVFLSKYSNQEKNDHNVVEIFHPKAIDGKMHIADVAHPLLVFVERLVQHLLGAKEDFVKKTGVKGANQVIQEWKNKRTPDDQEFEIKFYGPTGKKYGSPDGCQSLFSHLDLSLEYLEGLEVFANALEKHFKGNDSSDASSWNHHNTNIDRVVEIISIFNKAKIHYEHYMISCVVTANGSLSYAAGQEPAACARAKTVPLIFPDSQKSQNLPLSRCRHKLCGAIHGAYCDGSQPRWETAFVVRLLSPGILMSEISNSCRTLVLASGTLSPIQSLVAELDLTIPRDASKSVLFNNGLQLQPAPLEAEHIIDLQKQLLAVSIGHFPDGSVLTVKSANYNIQIWRRNLGNAICSVIESVPKGGVLVFLPSYSLLKKCVEDWTSSDQTSPSVLHRLELSKNKVIVEPTGSQDAFEDAREEYNKSIRLHGNCVLLAVYRGKMSEGVSFNDDFARAVICVGLPLPNFVDRAITAKRAYNDEQRVLRKRTDLLPGDEWYKQQAYRALAQALGRCIRHSTDYGTVVLMDSRHCHDNFMHLGDGGLCQAHKNLPKWMRLHVRNLSRNKNQCMNVQPTDGYPSSIPGGWPGLKVEMSRFFQEAVTYCIELEDKQRLAYRKAQESQAEEEVLQFNEQTGCWGAKDNRAGVSIAESSIKTEPVTTIASP